MTRTSKIARLPRTIREALNRRLEDGEPGRLLLEWLNSLPEAQAVLRRDFEGRPINEPNLTDWKQGGYLDWLTHRETMSQVSELAANADELAKASGGRLTDYLDAMLASRLAGELAAWDGCKDEERERRIRSIGVFCRYVTELQRGEINAKRFDIERERYQMSKLTEEIILDHFIRWIEGPRVRKVVMDETLGPKERRARIRAICEFPPEPEEKPPSFRQPEQSDTPSDLIQFKPI